MPTLPLPAIDPSTHASEAELAERMAALAPAPRDDGTLKLLVARGPGSERELPERTRLDDGGLPGDRWALAEAPNPEAQLATQQWDVAKAIAGGQPLSLFGDNLTLDLDLSEANLPVGSRLRIGDAVLVVTPKPHRGCAKYAARFGHAALRFIAARERRALRLRGGYLRVVESGEVAVGDRVHVLSRGPRAEGE
jgi:MOSC domain-containing protein YiiM